MNQNETASHLDEPDSGHSTGVQDSSRYTAGPDGTTILCDSPASSELPDYAEPDQSMPASNRRMTPPSTTAPRQDPPARKKTERVKPRRAIGNYTLISTLGSGSMGKVRLAVHNITQDKLAVKIVPRIGASDRSRDKKSREKDESREVRTIREASIMLLLHHPYIVSLKEMVVLDPYYYLFMEYVNGGQLLDYIISHGKLKEKHARRFARQIVSALDYCHRNSIVHRDLKIENILISQSGQIKIIDFGLSNLFSPRSHLSTFCGSLYFAAPELLNAKAYTGPEVDVWSFGIVLFVLTCGKVPFDDQNMAALHEKIKRGTVDYPAHLSTDCKSLMSRMLVVNPVHRATVSEIIVHPWMNKGYDGPVDNHLQDRAPLSLPVDMEVVRGMTGFGFGTEGEVRTQLEAIITSDEYQKAARTLVERTAEAHRNHLHLPSHHSPHTLSSSRFTQHSGITKRKPFMLPNDDPQSIPTAYHPLVSIYYLVKERMDRERRAADDTDTNGALSNAGSFDDMQASTLQVPELPVPETAHAVNTTHSSFAHPATHDNHLHLFGRGTAAGVAYGKKGKTNIRVDDEGRIVDSDRHHAFLESGFGRLFTRPNTSHRSTTTSGEHTDTNDDENGPLGRESGMLRRLSLAISRTSAEGHRGNKYHSRNQSMGTSTAAPSVTPVPIPSKSDSRSKQSVTPYGGGFPVTLQPTLSERPSQEGTAPSGGGLSQKFGRILSRRGTAGAGTPTASNSTGHHHLTFTRSHRSSTSASTSRQEASTSDTSKMSGQGPSMTNGTQSDAPNANEPRQHYHEQMFPPSISGSQRKGMADEHVKPVFLKGLFSVTTTSTKHPSVIRADLIRVLERIGVKWRESKGRFECVHVPSIDMNRVTGDESEDEHAPSHSQQQAWSLSDEDQTSTPSGAGGASGGVMSGMGGGMPITVPDLVVRFEIYIVKVPWLLGMHGLQFRRVSGDPWQYKNMCSRILAELKL